MAHQVIFRERALKQIAKLPKSIQHSIQQAAKVLAETPRPPKCKKLGGDNNLYRIRIRKVYRIIYEVQDDKLIVLVVKVGHRKEVYNL